MRFSQAFDPSSISAETISLKDGTGALHQGEIRLGEGNMTLFFKPYRPLRPGMEYLVEVNEEMRGEDQRPLSGKRRWQFQVAYDSPLKVVEREPKDGLLEAETTITLVFNRRVSPRSLQGGDLLLEGGGLPHKGSYGLDSSGKVLLFQPFSRLPPRTRFVLHLPPGLSDQDGNGLELESPLVFRTKGAGEGEATDAFFAQHRLQHGGGTGSLSAYFGGGVSGTKGASPPWVAKVLRVLRRKGYLDPSLGTSLDSPAGLSRYKAALLVDSARQRGAAMTSQERKLVGKLVQEFQPEMARLGRLKSDGGVEISAL
jgi:hypothetical protein